MLLSRTIRLMLGDGGRPVTNTWTGGPLAAGPVWPAELALEVRGAVDPASGFLCDIKAIDAVLGRAVDAVGMPEDGWFGWLQAVCAALDLDALPASADHLRLSLGNGIALSLGTALEAPMQYTEQFEFSAAHRLHVEGLSPAENHALFGKCNNPNGHGHNYVVEVTVYLPDSPEAGPAAVRSLAETVKREVIDRYDHRHLNLDVPDFAALNPTVENIAAKVFERLLSTPELGDRLQRVRVHETAKTWAELSREGV